MAMKLPTRPTHGPMRGLPLTIGSLPPAAFLILARPFGDRASPARSGTTFERSRIWPSASMIPGFSRPGRPKRRSFMSVSLFRYLQQLAGRRASCVRRRGGTSGSERAREHAAVDQQVLSGDVAGRGRAQERTGGAELVRRAEAPGRNRGGACGCDLVDRGALLLGGGLDVRAQAVGVEGARQQAIDGDV